MPKKTKNENKAKQEIDQLDHPWRSKSVLEYCYYECGLSLTQTGDKLGCDESTVRNWMETYDLPRRNRLEALSKDEPHLSTTAGGYTNIVLNEDGKTVSVGLHRLVACLDNDPYEVFAPCTDTHHRLAIPDDFGLKIDIAGNLEVLSRSEHRRLHARDYDRPHIDEVLNYDAKASREASNTAGFTEWSRFSSDTKAAIGLIFGERRERKTVADGGVTLDEVSRERENAINFDCNADDVQTAHPTHSPARTTWHTTQVPSAERPRFNRLHRLQHGRGHTYESFEGQRIHPQQTDKYLRCDAILQHCETGESSRRYALQKVMTEDLRGFSRFHDGADGAAVGFALVSEYTTPEAAKKSHVAAAAESILTCDVGRLIEYVFENWQ